MVEVDSLESCQARAILDSREKHSRFDSNE